jgi:phage I-like protein
MNTKLHAVTDAEGRPIRFFMTAGQVSDYTGAAALLGSLPKAEWLLADPMTALGLCSGAVARELAPGGAPDWVHLLPGGHIRGRDGRRFRLSDPDAVIRAFHAGAIDLPIDYEHQIDKEEARLNGPVPAAGWIKEMEARPTGLWARVDWTARAREMIANLEYRYLSPTLLYNEKTLEVVKLKGAGLVHHPNLHLTALASQETDMDPDATILQQIIEALDLEPDTEPEAVLAVIAKMRDAMSKAGADPADAQKTVAELAERLAAPDPAQFVPIATVRAMLAERNANIATMSEERAREKVTEATRKGYLSPAMQDWATALCRSDEASFDAFLAKSVPAFAHLTAESHLRGLPPGRGRTVTVPAEAEAICAQLGIEPSALSD